MASHRSPSELWIRRCANCRTQDREQRWLTPQEAQFEPGRSMVKRLLGRSGWRCAACGCRDYEVLATPAGDHGLGP